MAVRGSALGAVLAGLLACSCAWALNPALDAGQYAHTSWRFRDGFTKGEINNIAQTQDGYLWLGTSFGLYRFDGVNAVLWQPPPDQPLPSSSIRRMLAARDGTLWIGTANGLASWKNGKLTQYSDLSGFIVSRLIEDHAGSVWVGARESPTSGKLCEVRNGSIRCSTEPGDILGLHEGGNAKLWVGTFSGVWRWKPGSPQFFPAPIEANGIQDMADDSDGSLLIPASGGVRRIVDGKAQMAYPFPASARGFPAVRMLRDRDGGLWVGTSGSGIVHIHQGRADVYWQLDGLTANTIRDFLEDHEGNVWAATTGGLDRFRDLSVVTYTTNQGLSNTPNGPVLTTRDGSLWFTTGDGLNRLDGGQVTVYRQRRAGLRAGVREVVVPGLPDRLFNSLLEDSSGRIWVSAREGIGFLQNDRFVRTAVPGGVIDALAEDRAGNLWIANQDAGLFRLSPEQEVERVPWETLGRKDYARALTADSRQGGVWLGFFKGGIAWFQDGKVRASYSAAEGLGAGVVTQLQFDREGALWVATEGGLSRLKDGHIVTLTSRNGFSCDRVYWMADDHAGSVWLSMPCGLARLSRSELDAAVEQAGGTVHPTLFDNSDGFPARNAVGGGFTPHVAQSPDGKLWFENVDGLGMVDPRHLPVNQLPPPVEIEQIIADRKTYAAGAKLPPLVRDVEIDYTALSFVAPEKNRFRYKLEGRDRDWHEAGNRRQAFYNDLAPRSYRFRVMAANNRGVWNEAGASLDFSVAPAYYQTAWFYGLVAAAVVAVLTGLYRLRLLYLTKQFNANLEGRVSERTRVARDLHDTLLQSFQGVLLKFSTVKYVMRSRPDEAEATLDRLIEQARAAVTEGRDAVQGLRSSMVVANDLARAVTTFGEGLAADHAGPDCPAFRVFVEGKSRDLPPLVRDEVYKVACECLRNAFQHADARRIEVQIRYDPRHFWLQIGDNGKGIDPAVLSAGGRAGHHGLPGLHERAQLAGGKLSVWSEVNSGTEIELTIPGAIAYAKTTNSGRAMSAGKETG